MGDIANNAMGRLNHGVSYQVGSSAKMTYRASGESVDWAKGVANIKYSYVVELPDASSVTEGRRCTFELPAR